ncbi:terminase large subunit [Arsenicibacter rosenii]|uniref:Phage terminase large subunit C-terminal domain-containing protein n=1 Tax=Arsenicibacter rosenii TaxID=1750698 RepID=A0A1S2VGW0_9BACT|nr:terminase large subunit [Arsenicibacter rosenii]OIN58001.1 hypothetical protein BLX24_15805 [Arsenicibacter rosenii]
MKPINPTQIRLEQVQREQARRSFVSFVPYLKPDYAMTWFHEIMAGQLDGFAKGEFKKMMVFVPPQHGKSELSTRSLPAYLFGRNSALKIAVLSYSASKAKKFNREIQARITSNGYRALFPEVRLATAKDEAATRTTEEFDVLGDKGTGSLKSVGRGGPLTGDPVDVAILDDLLKDREEAQSPTIREKVWDWITDVVETRLHNHSRVLYVTTRWDEDDPAGRWLQRDGVRSSANPDGWEVVKFAALRTNDVLPYDNRRKGEALWPERHSRERIEAIKRNSPLTFNSLYQQDPKPNAESLIFGDWIEVPEMPDYCQNYFYGGDFGFTNDPTALVEIGIYGRNLYVNELIYQTGLTNPGILRLCKALGVNPKREAFWDKAEPKSIAELRSNYYTETGESYSGINAIETIKGAGSIVAGINKLKDYVVHYTASSHNIRREKNLYQWIMQNGKSTNVPIDAHNHTLDAIRGAVYTKYFEPKGTAKAHRIPVKVGRFGRGSL